MGPARQIRPAQNPGGRDSGCNSSRQQSRRERPRLQIFARSAHSSPIRLVASCSRGFSVAQFSGRRSTSNVFDQNVVGYVSRAQDVFQAQPRSGFRSCTVLAFLWSSSGRRLDARPRRQMLERRLGTTETPASAKDTVLNTGEHLVGFLKTLVGYRGLKRCPAGQGWVGSVQPAQRLRLVCEHLACMHRKRDEPARRGRFHLGVRRYSRHGATAHGEAVVEDPAGVPHARAGLPFSVSRPKSANAATAFAVSNLPSRDNRESAAAAMDSALISKCRRRCSRFSLRP